MCCGDAPAPPQPDPLIGQAAKENAEIAREALAFNRDQYYNFIVPRQQEADKLTKQVVGQQLRIADSNEARAQEQYDFYRSIYQPLERQSVADAANYDSEARKAQQAGIAASDVARSFANAEAQNVRANGRMGVDPSSGRTRGLDVSVINAKALGTAGATTAARNDVTDKAISLRSGATNLGRGIQNTVGSAFGTSIAAGGGAAGINASNNAAYQAGLGVMNQGYSLGSSINQSAAGIAQNQFNGEMQAYQAGLAADSAKYAAIGSLAGSGAAVYASKGSDIRLKTDIVHVGVDPSGVNLYEFTYLSEPDRRYRGVMAQELLNTRPDAVVVMPNGFYGVDYDKLGIEFVEVTQ